MNEYACIYSIDAFMDNINDDEIYRINTWIDSFMHSVNEYEESSKISKEYTDYLRQAMQEELDRLY